MATISHRYSLQEHIFLLSAYYLYSAEYELIFNNFQKRFLSSLIPRCEAVYRSVKHFEKMRSVEDSKLTNCPCSVLIEENMQQVVQTLIVTSAPFA